MVLSISRECTVPSPRYVVFNRDKIKDKISLFQIFYIVYSPSAKRRTILDLLRFNIFIEM